MSYDELKRHTEQVRRLRRILDEGGEMSDTIEVPDDKAACPWCGAEPRDTWSFACGRVRPNVVTPSAVQADSCRIGLLRRCLQALVDTYPQRQLMLEHIQRAKELLQ